MNAAAAPATDANAAAAAVAHPLAGARVALATMHGKAEALAPALASLGIALTVPADIDTDALGTFSGEIPRALPPRETAVAKARLAMAATGLRYGLATEGSFGPDPAIGLIALHHELAVLVDDVHGQIVCETLASHDTNYAGTAVADAEALDAALFARWGFPEHALLVRCNAFAAGQPVHKGLRSHAALAAAIRDRAGASADGLARVEADMRAHVNPTRMRQIARLGERLAQRLRVRCPACAAPGFGRIALLPGLPCALCGAATAAARGELHGCGACGTQREQPRGDGLAAGDPASCDHCNP